MGLYDNVTVECELPGPPVTNRGFQTKDFECYSNTVTITKEGRLLYTTWHYVDAPERAKEPGADLFALFGLPPVRGEPDPPRDMNFHGIFTFGNAERAFRAKFTDGRLVEIVSLPEDT